MMTSIDLEKSTEGLGHGAYEVDRIANVAEQRMRPKWVLLGAILSLTCLLVRLTSLLFHTH